MSDELRDLYQEVILDHGRNPRNCRHPEESNQRAHGDNPLCGDTVDVFLTVDEDGTIRDAAFEGHGCAISVASASLMTEVLKGKSRDEARQLFETFQGMCTGRADADKAAGSLAGEVERLRVLAGVNEFPLRVKCATLAWHTMSAAMSGTDAIKVE